MVVSVNNNYKLEHLLTFAESFCYNEMPEGSKTATLGFRLY